LLAVGCRGAQIDVRIQSSEILRNVVVSANGSSTTIGRIAAGDTRQRFLCPRGEAGSVDVSFQVNGQIHRQRRPVYFECDFQYRVRVDVSPEFEIVVDTNLR
jgi:hypothetical protein